MNHEEAIGILKSNLLEEEKIAECQYLGYNLDEIVEIALEAGDI